MAFARECSCDGLLNHRVRFWQPRQGYRVAMDTVFLAAALDPKPGSDILEMGCGVGAASLCLAARCPQIRIIGIDNHLAMTRLATANIILNQQQECLLVLSASIAAPPFKDGIFDQVMLNPPYWPRHSHTVSPYPEAASAMSEGDPPLRVWIETALRLVKTPGCVTMILPTGRVGELLSFLDPFRGEICLKPITARPENPPKRTIIRLRKGLPATIRSLRPFVIHATRSDYTPPAHAILREGNALPMI